MVFLVMHTYAYPQGDSDTQKHDFFLYYTRENHNIKINFFNKIGIHINHNQNGFDLRNVIKEIHKCSRQSSIIKQFKRINSTNITTN